MLSVEIADGVSENVEIHEGDNARELAINFCVLHSLDEKIVDALEKHIRTSVERVQDIQAKKLQQKHQRQQQQSGGRDSSPFSSTATKTPVQAPLASDSRRPASARPASPMRHGERHQHREEQEMVTPSGGSRGGSRASDDVHSRLYNHAKRLEKRRKEAATSSTVNGSERTPEEGAASHRPRPYGGAKGLGFINRRDNVINRSMHGEYRNFGERLYVEGIVAKEQRRLRAASALNEREANEMAELRASPQISQLARSMQSAEQDMRRSWQRLSDGAGSEAGGAGCSARRNRIMIVKKEMENKEVKECSFKPRISVKSKELMKDRMNALREHNIPYHEQLFHDAERRRLMQEEVSNWFPEDHTFHPNNSASQSSNPTGKSSPYSGAGSFGGSSSSSKGQHHRSNPHHHQSLDVRSEEELVARLTTVNTSTMDRMRHIKELESKVDLESGQELFKPRTGRAPQYERNRSKLPIGEYLYGLRYEFDDKKEFMMEKEMRKIDEDAHRKKTNAKSDALMLSVMRRRFEAVFAFLDGEDEGTINLESVAAEELDDEVEMDLHETCSRLQQEKRNRGEPGSAVLVDRKTFVNAMIDTVRRGHRKHPRSYLFSTAHRKSHDGVEDDHMNPSFKPKLNRRSKHLAGSRRVEGVPVEAALMQSKMDAEMRVERRRIELERAEMSECTFKPKLNTMNKSPQLATSARPKSAQSAGKRVFQGLRDSYERVALDGDASEGGTYGGSASRTSELERLAFGDGKDFEQLEMELQLDLHADPVEMEQVAAGSGDGRGGLLRDVVARQTEDLLKKSFGSYTQS